MKCAKAILAAMALLLWTAACGGGASSGGQSPSNHSDSTAQGGMNGPYTPPADDSSSQGSTSSVHTGGGSAPSGDAATGSGESGGSNPAGSDTAGSSGSETASPPAPAPIVPVDYSFVANLALDGERDADLEELPSLLTGYENESFASVLTLISGEIPDDAVLARIADSVRQVGAENEPMGPAGVDGVIGIVDASRRADRAVRRLTLLEEGLPGTPLEANGLLRFALDDAKLRAQAFADEVEAMLNGDLAAYLRGGPAELPQPVSGLLAPNPAMLTAILALDANLVSGRLLDRARAGDRNAADLVAATLELRIRMSETLGAPGSELLRPVLDEMRARIAEIDAGREPGVVLVPAPAGHAPSLFAESLPHVGIEVLDAGGAEVDARANGVRLHRREASRFQDAVVSFEDENATVSFRIHVEIVDVPMPGGRSIEIQPLVPDAVEWADSPADFSEIREDADRLFLRVDDDHEATVGFVEDGITGTFRIGLDAVPENAAGASAGGVVLGAAGVPAAGLRVSLVKVGEENRIARAADGRLLTTHTDEDGRYDFDAVPAGEYSLAIGLGEGRLLIESFSVRSAGSAPAPRIEIPEAIVPADR